MKIYLVFKEDSLVFASTDKDEAETYEYDNDLNAINAVLGNAKIEDPEIGDLMDASYQAGRDGDFCETYCIDLSDYSNDDTIFLGNGLEAEHDDIIAMLKNCEAEEDLNYLED